MYIPTISLASSPLPRGLPRHAVALTRSRLIHVILRHMIKIGVSVIFILLAIEQRINKCYKCICIELLYYTIN